MRSLALLAIYALALARAGGHFHESSSSSSSTDGGCDDCVEGPETGELVFGACWYE
jgi:hypothetical protein